MCYTLCSFCPVFIYRVTQNQRSHPLSCDRQTYWTGRPNIAPIPQMLSQFWLFWPEHFFRCVHHSCMCWLNDTHLMGPLSLVSCLLLHVDASACFIWRIDVLLLSINMASAANDLCISVDLWFQRLPLFVVTICNNNFVLHLPEVAALHTVKPAAVSV